MPIIEVQATGNSNKATLFFDSGSNTSYITHGAAKRLKARKLTKATLDITTMGNVETQYKYEV